MDLDLCPGAESSTCRNEVIFSLEVKASDLDGDALSYHYSATTGVISGDGPLVNWELAKVGSHSATVEVTDGKGGRVSAAVIGVVRPCTTCDPPRPFISVTCPSNVTEGQVVIFTANISGSDQNDKLSYDWRVANGQVDQGQGTPTLKVKATGAVGESVTATVDVQGLDPSVNREASCSSEIQKPR
jgi:hypothetical protein